jgi:hypothetical protein
MPVARIDLVGSGVWRGRAVKLVDGTGISMPDTEESQARYPQPSSQAHGVGFPQVRLVHGQRRGARHGGRTIPRQR